MLTDSSAENNIGPTIWEGQQARLRIGSNFSPCHPQQTSQWFSRESKQYMCVPVPNVIKMYNRNMAGTDRLDNNVTNYRTDIRGI